MKNSFLLIVFLFSSFLIAQTKSTSSSKAKTNAKTTTQTKVKSDTKKTTNTTVVPNSGIVPPEKIAMTFQKEYPNKKAVWSQEYVGDDNDEIRYEAKFNTDKNEKALAVYDNLGTLKAFELEIPISKLPNSALTYLKNNY